MQKPDPAAKRNHTRRTKRIICISVCKFQGVLTCTAAPPERGGMVMYVSSNYSARGLQPAVRGRTTFVPRWGHWSRLGLHLSGYTQGSTESCKVERACRTTHHHSYEERAQTLHVIVPELLHARVLSLSRRQNKACGIPILKYITVVGTTPLHSRL